MAFESFAAFLQMGKHGIHVWLSYGIFVVLFVSLYCSERLKTKKLKQQLAELAVNKS